MADDTDEMDQSTANAIADASEQLMRRAEDHALAVEQTKLAVAPGIVIEAPAGWTRAQIAEFQRRWDAVTRWVTPMRRWTLRQRLAAAWRAFLEVESASVRTEREVAEILTVLGVPTERHGETFDLPRRLGIFVDRLSERLHTQVENNMIYYNLCREVVVLLEGSPNSANFRTKVAIQKLKAATLPPSVGRGERPRESSLILPS